MEFYITSPWVFKDPAVAALLSQLKNKHLNSELVWEHEHNWLKVTCQPKHVSQIQALFRATLHAIEDEHLTYAPHLQADGQFIDELQKNDFLARRSDQDAVSNSAYKDKACPASFDEFASTKAWTRMRDELSVDHQLLFMISRDQLEEVMKVTRTRISLDHSNRVAYIGGNTNWDVDKVVCKLETLFKYFKQHPSPQRTQTHLLHSETDEEFVVDLRFVRLINLKMTRSLIVDPRTHHHYGKWKSGNAYEEIFYFGAALRIAQRVPMKQGMQSLFGPALEPVPHEGLNSKFRPLVGLRFATKAKGDYATVSPQVLVPAPQLPSDRQVKAWLEQTEADTRNTQQALDRDAPIPGIAPNRDRNAPIAGVGPRPTRTGPHSGEASKRRFHVTMNQKAGRKPTPLPELKKELDGILGSLRAKVGNISLQADLGRIYVMNPFPNGLATNQPGERTRGWSEGELLQTLNEDGAKIAFNKALTTSGYDANSLTAFKHNDQYAYWKFKGTKVYYDFFCVFQVLDWTGKLVAELPEVVIQVDGTQANSFTYSIRVADAALEDTKAVWVHCIKRNNDVQFTVRCTDTAMLEARFGEFAQELVNSISVPENQVEDPVLEFSDEPRLHREQSGQKCKISVREVRTRIVAEGESFHQHKGTLNISTIQLMKTRPIPTSDQSASRVRATALKTDNPKELVAWHEAHISVEATEELFKQNEALEIGEEVNWTVQDFDRRAVVDILRRDALAMVEQMDGFGAEHDNGTRFELRSIDKSNKAKAVANEYYYGNDADNAVSKW